VESRLICEEKMPTGTRKTYLYQIHIETSFESNWSEWLEEPERTINDCGKAEIKGFCQDQSSLFAIVKQIRDSGAEIVSILRIKRHDTCMKE